MKKNSTSIVLNVKRQTTNVRFVRLSFHVSQKKLLPQGWIVGKVDTGIKRSYK